MKPADPNEPSSPVSEEKKFISYQTNRIPWYIHLMWMTFAVTASVYLLKFALSDFLRWW